MTSQLSGRVLILYTGGCRFKSCLRHFENSLTGLGRGGEGFKVHIHLSLHTQSLPPPPCIGWKQPAGVVFIFSSNMRILICFGPKQAKYEPKTTNVSE